MNSYKMIILVCIISILAGCKELVYQHRSMTGKQQTWGKSQIYRMWINGWFKKNISNRDRDEYEPDVHHKNKKIVFLAGDNKIYVMGIDGNNVTEVPNAPIDVGAPRWGRGETGNFILFSHPASFLQSAIYLISHDGTGLKKITNPSVTQKDEVADSVNDKYMVFCRYDTTNNQDRDLYMKSIWDNQPEVNLTNTPEISETLPVVSHSGKMLAYRVYFGTAQDDLIYVASFNNLASITTLYTIDLELPADTNISGIDFSRDDKELFVSTQATDVPENPISRKQEIFRVRLDGSNQRRLTNNTDLDSCPNSVP